MAPYCPLCGFTIELVQLNLSESVKLCSNAKCVYPIGTPKLNLEFVQRDYKTLTTNRIQSKHVQSCEVKDNFLETFFDGNESEATVEDIDDVQSLFESLQTTKVSQSDSMDIDNYLSTMCKEDIDSCSIADLIKEAFGVETTDSMGIGNTVEPHLSEEMQHSHEMNENLVKGVKKGHPLPQRCGRQHFP